MHEYEIQSALVSQPVTERREGDQAYYKWVWMCVFVHVCVLARERENEVKRAERKEKRGQERRFVLLPFLEIFVKLS